MRPVDLSVEVTGNQLTRREDTQNDRRFLWLQKKNCDR